MSAQPIVIDPIRRDLEQQVATYANRARELAVTGQESYAAACEMLLGIKDLRRQAEDHHRPMIDAAHKAHKATLDALKKIDGPLEEAERIIKPKLTAYQAEKRRLQEQRESEAREAAVRAAAETMEAAIEAAEAEGATPEEVQAIIHQPIATPVVYVPPAVQQVAGVSTAKTYRAEVFNLRELCKAVTTGTAPEACVVPNMPTLNGLARSTRGSMQIPGVRIVEDTTVRAGRR
jgi:hypothetical protein